MFFSFQHLYTLNSHKLTLGDKQMTSIYYEGKATVLDQTTYILDILSPNTSNSLK